MKRKLEPKIVLSDILRKQPAKPYNRSVMSTNVMGVLTSFLPSWNQEELGVRTAASASVNEDTRHSDAP